MKIKENSFTYILICVSLLYVENSIFYDFFNQHRYKIGNLKIKSSISSSLHIFKQSKRRVKIQIIVCMCVLRGGSGGMEGGRHGTGYNFG